MKKSLIAFLWAFLLIALIGCAGKGNHDSAASDTDEPILERIKLTDLSGQAVNLHDYQGKTIFINFWATWCRPCIAEMPSIVQARQQFKEEDIVFLFASNEDVTDIRSFIEKRNLDLTAVRLENLEELGIQGLPTTFIIDPAGKLVFSDTGYRKWDSPDNIELIRKTIVHE